MQPPRGPFYFFTGGRGDSCFVASPLGEPAAGGPVGPLALALPAVPLQVRGLPAVTHVSLPLS